MSSLRDSQTFVCRNYNCLLPSERMHSLVLCTRTADINLQTDLPLFKRGTRQRSCGDTFGCSIIRCYARKSHLYFPSANAICFVVYLRGLKTANVKKALTDGIVAHRLRRNKFGTFPLTCLLSAFVFFFVATANRAAPKVESGGKGGREKEVGCYDKFAGR